MAYWQRFTVPPAPSAAHVRSPTPSTRLRSQSEPVCTPGRSKSAVTTSQGSRFTSDKRVASRAAAGEVLVSRTVADLITGSDIELVDQGEHELKGVSGTWRLFSVR